MKKSRYSKEYKKYALMKVNGLTEFTRIDLTNTLPFQFSSISDIARECFDNGLMGRVKNKTKGGKFNYFITYRGRKFLHDNGVKSQEKYLNIIS